MLCTNCSKNQATTHIKRIINGHIQEFHLCPECAAKSGMTNFNPFDLSDFWGSFFNTNLDVSNNERRCDACGYSFSDIASKGKLGCPKCYSSFYDELIPSIRKIHGKTTHIGRVPENFKDKNYENLQKLKELKENLKVAIEKEEYEKAAQLRDKIKLLEKEVKDNESQ